MPLDFSQMYMNFSSNELGQVNGGRASLTIEQTVDFFKGIKIVAEDIIGNALNAYTISNNIKGDKVIFGQFGEVKWITRDAPTGCTATAVGGMIIKTNQATLCDRHVFMELCNRELLNSCWSSMFRGAGNDVTNLLSTPGGQLAYVNFIETAMRGMGSDYVDTAKWSGHPIIADALAANTKLSSKIKDAILETLGTCTGYITLVDALKTKGESNFNAELNPNECIGNRYTGDAMALVENFDDYAKRNFSEALNSLEFYDRRVIGFASASVFRRLKEQIHFKYNTIPADYYWRMTGKVFDTTMPDLKNTVAPGVLVFDDKIIVEQKDWKFFANYMGFYEHRLLMTVPYNIGLGFDIAPISNNDGFGLIVQKSPLLEKMGLYQMMTNYRQAQLILDPNFMVNYSHLELM